MCDDEIESSFATMEVAVNKAISPQGPFSSCSRASYHITQASSADGVAHLLRKCRTSPRGHRFLSTRKSTKTF